jgi:hypothetical protein
MPLKLIWAATSGPAKRQIRMAAMEWAIRIEPYESDHGFRGPQMLIGPLAPDAGLKLE